MKNSLKLLTLGLVLFLGACVAVVENPTEVDPTGFLGKVLDKTMFMDVGLTQTKGAFSLDGKNFTIPNFNPTVFVFIKSSGPNSAIYETVITAESPTMQTITVYTVDGISGTLDSDTGLQGMWLGSATPEFDAEAAKTAFVALVTGKAAYTELELSTPYGTFSTDGLVFALINPEGPITFSFSKMIATGTAEFINGGTTYTFIATTATTGSVTISGVPTDLWFDPFDAELEKTLFKNNIMGKTAYSDVLLATPLGAFNADGTTFTPKDGVPLTLSKMTTIGTAIFTDNTTTYTFTTPDGITGSLIAGTTLTPSIWFNPTAP